MKIYQHPFKEGVISLIERHFGPSISKKFVLEFEANIFSDESLGVRNQIKTQNYVLEVKYREGDDFIYICDVHSWWTRAQTEAHLLQYITDKVRDGKIGKYWGETNGKISEDIKSGKHETKEVTN